MGETLGIGKGSLSLGKQIGEARIVVSGAGADTAIDTAPHAAGVNDVVVYDRPGCLVPDLPGPGPVQQQLAEATDPRWVTGGLHDALRDAEVFIGVGCRTWLRSASPVR